MKKLLIAALLTSWSGSSPNPYRVRPYLQDPRTESMRVLWISHSSTPGQVQCWDNQGHSSRYVSQPRAVPALAYNEFEARNFFQGRPPSPGYQHEVLVQGLQPGRTYAYEVKQDGCAIQSQLTSTPSCTDPVRFIAYADSETEPESTGAKVRWDGPRGERRQYLIDQTDGYAANLRAISARRPNFIAIAGDIVESGGEQRDWDEFWRHNQQVAAQTPIAPAIGNHEYYAGPQNGHYNDVLSEAAVAKFLTYFRVPDNHAPNPAHRGRYYRMDYGPISYIAIDGCNGRPENSSQDTNFHLKGKACQAPDFNPGSRQYHWLEQELRDARQRSRFVFVCFHHCPLSSGLHAAPPGTQKPLEDPQSGRPLQALLPLFVETGVDVLLNGHDEMMERSEYQGLQVYDVGVGGDGLRGPELSNPYCKFLAHHDAPERWQDGVLLDGGKHYGHLEVNVSPGPEGWSCEMTPVYIFPVFGQNGQVKSYERRIYPDVVRLAEKVEPR
jgi:hypothetical protein